MQVSVLSVTLFLVAINGVVHCIRSPVESCLYADYLAIYLASRSMVSVERRIQLAVNRASAWLAENGLALSASKTVCV